MAENNDVLEPTFLSLKEVLCLHQAQIDLFGGSTGLRDEGALDSALEAPRWDFYYKQADEIDVAAAYCYHLIQAHAFVDGNKRVGIATALTFLDMAEIWLEIPDGELEQIGLDVAQGLLNKEQLAETLRRFRAQ